ncbi:hypothetical protein ACTXT7_017179 [Hymenolepis weldensis]
MEAGPNLILPTQEAKSKMFSDRRAEEYSGVHRKCNYTPSQCHFSVITMGSQWHDEVNRHSSIRPFSDQSYSAVSNGWRFYNLHANTPDSKKEHKVLVVIEETHYSPVRAMYSLFVFIDTFLNVKPIEFENCIDFPTTLFSQQSQGFYLLADRPLVCGDRSAYPFSSHFHSQKSVTLMAHTDHFCFTSHLITMRVYKMPMCALQVRQLSERTASKN